ncbi:hypothetical protein DPMN_001580 [Dreissena polymorpha]|uniref:SUI1 domain-containing protein n=1 Tax=Dreissena polymorpha TaxID=45954 RepID=A0A9D4ML60_DREPO|nr:hypothetical protein DPMN_001580 [Dreissena polymorpha]
MSVGRSQRFQKDYYYYYYYDYYYYDYYYYYYYTTTTTTTVHIQLATLILKMLQSFFSDKFACGSTVQGEDEICIQGDVKDDLFDVLPEKWKAISEDDIDDVGEIKK